MRDDIGRLSDPDKALIAQFVIEGVNLAIFEHGGAHYLYKIRRDTNTIDPDGIELDGRDTEHILDFVKWLRTYVSRHKKRPRRKPPRGRKSK
jgi:hypothetical protein